MKKNATKILGHYIIWKCENENLSSLDKDMEDGIKELIEDGAKAGVVSKIYNDKDTLRVHWHIINWVDISTELLNIIKALYSYEVGESNKIEETISEMDYILTTLEKLD